MSSEYSVQQIWTYTLDIMKRVALAELDNGMFEDDLTTLVPCQPRFWANKHLAPWMAPQLQTSRLVNLIGPLGLHELSSPATWLTPTSRQDSFFSFLSAFFSLRHGLRDLSQTILAS